MDVAKFDPAVFDSAGIGLASAFRRLPQPSQCSASEGPGGFRHPRPPAMGLPGAAYFASRKIVCRRKTGLYFFNSSFSVVFFLFLVVV